MNSLSGIGFSNWVRYLSYYCLEILVRNYFASLAVVVSPLLAVPEIIFFLVASFFVDRTYCRQSWPKKVPPNSLNYIAKLEDPDLAMVKLGKKFQTKVLRMCLITWSGLLLLSILYYVPEIRLFDVNTSSLNNLPFVQSIRVSAAEVDLSSSKVNQVIFIYLLSAVWIFACYIFANRDLRSFFRDSSFYPK